METYSYILDQPDELIYQQCLKMSDQALSRFIRTSTRIYDICNEILEKRKERFGTTVEEHVRYRLAEINPKLLDEYDKLDQFDQIIVNFYVLNKREAEDYLSDILDYWLDRYEQAKDQVKIIARKQILFLINKYRMTLRNVEHLPSRLNVPYTRILNAYGVQPERTKLFLDILKEYEEMVRN